MNEDPPPRERDSRTLAGRRGPGRSPGVGTTAAYAAVSAAVLATLLTSLGYWDYTADDGFIHLTFARHLAGSLTFTFSGGVPVNGSTSPLWNIVVALLALSGLAPLAAVKVLGYAFAVLAATSGAWLAARLAGPEAGWLAALVLCCDPWLLRWAVSGLETSMAVALILLALALFGAGRFGAGCAVAGWLPLVRPEMILFVALYGLSGLTVRKSPGTALRASAALLAPGALWCLYAWWTFGSVVPNSVRSKTLNYADGFVERLAAIGKIAIVGHGLLLAVTAVAVVLTLRRGGRFPGGRLGLVMAAWPPALLLGYVVSGSAAVSRYYLPGTTVAFLLAIVWLARRGPNVRYGIPLASCGVSLAFTLVVVAPAIRDYAANFNRAAIEITERLNALAQRGDVVAARDVGYLGYYNTSGYRILDLAGLVTPEMLERDAERDAHVLDRRPRFIVERGPVVDAIRAAVPLEKFGIEAFREAGALRFETAAFLGRAGLNAERSEWYTLYSVDGARMERVLELAGAAE